MGLSPKELRDEVNDGLRALRYTLDRRNLPIHLEERIALASQLEAVRIFVRQSEVGRHRFHFRSEIGRLEEALSKLRDDIHRSPIAPLPCMTLGTTRNTKVSLAIRGGATCADVANFMIFEVHNIPTDEQLEDVRFEEIPLDFDGEKAISASLKAIVPAQKISPVRFEVVEGKLSIIHTPAMAEGRDADAARSARSSLVERGRELVDEIKNSNIDRRVLADIVALQSHLESSDDIVKLGILNLACQQLKEDFKDELSVAVASKLSSHIAGIAMYVAQFPDWKRFSENAAEVELHPNDVAQAKALAIDMVSKLEGEPEKVDVEVPKTIRMIAEAVDNPALAKTRVAFALIRTLENLCISIFDHISTFASSSASKTVKLGSSAVAVWLSTLVIHYTKVLNLLAENVAGMSWLKSAIEIMSKIL